VSGHDDHGDIGKLLSQSVERVETAHPGHHQVEEDGPHRPLASDAKALGCIRDSHRLVAFVGYDLDAEFAYEQLVVDDQNRVLGRRLGLPFHSANTTAEPQGNFQEESCRTARRRDFH
jgi:hypothetical protein